MVITSDFDSDNLSSILSGTFIYDRFALERLFLVYDDQGFYRHLMFYRSRIRLIGLVV